uniref:Uncharacterized protein n=1 Tax=Megaselia scalaris TaxID=36166 RepID=T1GQN2_MEGSC
MVLCCSSPVGDASCSRITFSSFDIPSVSEQSLAVDTCGTILGCSLYSTSHIANTPNTGIISSSLFSGINRPIHPLPDIPCELVSGINPNSNLNSDSTEACFLEENTLLILLIATIPWDPVLRNGAQSGTVPSDSSHPSRLPLQHANDLNGENRIPCTSTIATQ